MLNPTYHKDIDAQTGRMVATQQRAVNSINKVFRFCECHPRCGCNKDICHNFLIHANNKKSYKLQVIRVKKKQLGVGGNGREIIMWGL